MAVKKGGENKKKHTVAKLNVRVLNKKEEVKKSEEIISDDLLPESREFLEEQKKEEVYIPAPEQYEVDPEILEKEEKYKSMIMWSGISFFMILILVIWGFNMKNVFKNNSAKAKSNNPDISKNWNDFSDQLSKVMSALDQTTQELKDKAQASTTPNVLPKEETTVSTSTINDLIDKLETATSTATTTIVVKPTTSKKKLK